MNIDQKRHKLLGILTEQRKQFELNIAGYNALGVSFESIYKAIDCDKDELHSITSELYTSGEIGYHDAHNIVGLFAKDKGVSAFGNKKYYNRIIDRRKERIKFILPFLAILISIISLYFSNFAIIEEKNFNKVNKEMQKKLDSLEIEVNKLKTRPFKDQNVKNEINSMKNGKN